MEKKNSRGSVLLTYFKFIKHKWGIAGVQQAEEDIGFGPEKIKDSQWYDMKMNDSIVQWISEKKGEHYLEELGQYIVTDLGLLSYIVRFMNFRSFLKKFQENYDELFDYGSVDITSEEKTISVKIKDNAVSEYSCPVWLGSCRGMLKATKTEGTVEKTRCQLKDDDFCEYVFHLE